MKFGVKATKKDPHPSIHFFEKGERLEYSIYPGNAFWYKVTLIEANDESFLNKLVVVFDEVGSDGKLQIHVIDTLFLGQPGAIRTGSGELVGHPLDTCFRDGEELSKIFRPLEEPKRELCRLDESPILEAKAEQFWQKVEELEKEGEWLKEKAEENGILLKFKWSRLKEK